MTPKKIEFFLYGYPYISLDISTSRCTISLTQREKYLASARALLSGRLGLIRNFFGLYNVFFIRAIKKSIIYIILNMFFSYYLKQKHTKLIKFN